MRVALAGILVAILVHSLFYDALFQDVTFWGVVALLAASSRASATAGARASEQPRAR